MDWVQILQGAAWAALAAALTAAVNYIRLKTNETKIEVALAADDLVERIVDRNVETAEQVIGSGHGEEKKALAEAGIKDDLKAAGKAVGKTVLTAVVGGIGRWIETAVSRKFSNPTRKTPA